MNYGQFRPNGAICDEEEEEKEQEEGEVRECWANTQSWSNLDKSIYSHARNYVYPHAYFMNLMVEGIWYE